MHILDSAWLTILRLHPELNLDASGLQAPLKRNHGLLHAVNSTSLDEVQPSDFPDSYFSINFPPSKKFRESEDWTCLINIHGWLIIVRSVDSTEIVHENILNSFHTPRESNAETDHADPKKEQLSPVLLDTYGVYNDSPSIDKESARRVSRVVRFVFHTVQLTREPRPSPEATKKTAKQTEELPQFDEKVSFQFLVVDVAALYQTESAQWQWRVSRRMEIVVDSLSLDTWTEKEYDASADLSLDGQLLALSTAGEEGGVRLYHLPDPFSAAARAQDSADLAPADLIPRDTQQATATVEGPSLLNVLGPSHRLLSGSMPRRVYLLPSSLPSSSPVPVPVQAHAVEAPPLALAPPEVVVILRDSAHWLLLGLRLAPPSTSQPPSAAEDAKKKSKEKEKEAASPSPAPAASPWSWYQIGSWNLTATVSASALDGRRQLLTLGLLDGCLLFWTLPERAPLGLAAKHRGAVTDILVLAGPQSPSQASSSSSVSPPPLPASVTGEGVVVSAGLDGSICFFAAPSSSSNSSSSSSSLLANSQLLSSSSSNSSSSISSSAAAASGGRTVAPQLVDYRQDVPRSAILRLQPLVAPPSSSSLGTPAAFFCFFAHYSCGTVAAYEWKSPRGRGGGGDGERWSGCSLLASLGKWEKDPRDPLSRLSLGILTRKKIQALREVPTPSAESTAAALAGQGEHLGGSAPSSPSPPSPSPSPPQKGTGKGDADSDGRLVADFLTGRMNLPSHVFLAAVNRSRQGGGTLQVYCTLVPAPSPSLASPVSPSPSPSRGPGAEEEEEEKKPRVVLASFPLAAIGGGFHDAWEVKEVAVKDPFLPIQSAVTGAPSGVSISARPRSPQSGTSSYKQLTKARLAAFQQSQGMEKKVPVPAVKGRSRLEIPPVIPLIPAAVIKKEVLLSKLERVGRKKKLLTNMNDLMSYIS